MLHSDHELLNKMTQFLSIKQSKYANTILSFTQRDAFLEMRLPFSNTLHVCRRFCHLANDNKKWSFEKHRSRQCRTWQHDGLVFPSSLRVQLLVQMIDTSSFFDILRDIAMATNLVAKMGQNYLPPCTYRSVNPKRNRISWPQWPR